MPDSPGRILDRLGEEISLKPSEVIRNEYSALSDASENSGQAAPYQPVAAAVHRTGRLAVTALMLALSFLSAVILWPVSSQAGTSYLPLPVRPEGTGSRIRTGTEYCYISNKDIGGKL